MMKLTALLHLAILLCGCVAHHNHENNVQLTAFPDTVSVTGEKLPLDILQPSGVYRVGDCLVVMQRSDEQMVHIYDTAMYARKAAIISKGNGPRESLIVNFVTQIVGDTALWIVGFPYFSGLLNVKKTVETRRAVFDREFDFRQSGQMPVLLASNIVYHTDSDLVMLMDPGRSGQRGGWNAFYIRYDFQNREASDTLYISKFAALSEGADYRPLASIAERMRPDLKKSAVIFSYLGRIHLIDHQTGEVKVLWQKFEPEPVLEPKVVYSEARHLGICATQDRFIVLCQDPEENQGKSYLEVYDWDGNPVVRINLPDVIWYPDIDDKGWLYGVDMEEKIVRYPIGRLI